MVVLNQLSILEHLEVRQPNTNRTSSVKMSVFGESKKTFKLTYAAPCTWRKIFLVYDNEVFRPKEKIIYDRHSTIPMFFVGSKVKIYSGSKFHSRIVNR